MCSMKAFRLALVLVASCAAFADSVAQQSTPAAAAPTGSAPPRTFAQVVNQYFSQWDANGDGTLTPDEIGAAVANPQFHDEAAAALAAIHMVVRGGKYTLPSITQSYLVSSPLRETSTSGEQAVLQDDPAKPGKIDHPPAFQSRYRTVLRRLRTASRDLFPQSLPSLGACRQGPLGDCYFVSVVGAMVSRNPAAVKAMFTQNRDGSTTIAIGDGRKVKASPLTEAEIAISSYAGTNGLWLTVLENAYGKIRLEAQGANQQDEPDTDAIAHGGQPRLVINMLDGHQTRTILFVLGGERRGGPQFATTIRQDLIAALREHLLVATGTSTNAQLPPGINPHHAYAILGFNSGTGLVHVWNPHGNNFAPKGPDGLQYGYTTKAGEFDIPLKDWLQVYQYVTFEMQAPYRH
ncbi:MAG: C2 family cysteine protease [Verrucomicrobiota bacterium]|jgi:hypothetical protein